MDNAGRAFVGVVLGVVVGFLLGGFGPRREVAKLRSENEALADQLIEAQRKGRRQSMTFLPIPDDGGDDRPRPPRSPAPTPSDGEPAASPTPDADRKPDLETFRMAVDAQKIRIRQSRQVIADKASLSESEEEQLEALLTKMNEQLAEHADELAETIVSGEEPEPLDMLETTHEVTGILLDAQKQYESLLGNDFGGLDENTQSIWTFIDLQYFESAFANSGLDVP